MKNFKKILSILPVVMAVCDSCTTDLAVVSQSAYKQEMAALQNRMEERGYVLSGSSNNVKNEVAVNGVSYSRLTGYGTSMKNNYWNYDEYVFTDSANNTVSFTTKYMLKSSVEKVTFVDQLEVTGCNANKDYNEICSGSGEVKSTIRKLNDNPDRAVKVSNPGATTAAAIGVSLGLCVIALIAVLAL